MKRHFIWILASLIIALPVWAGSYTVNFDDAQDAGAVHWGGNLEQPIGKWSFSDGMYVIEAEGGHWAASLWGDMNWEDYAVEVRARSTNGVGCIAITLRAQDALNYYLWAFDVKGNKLAWLRGINGEFIHQTVDPAPGNPLDEHVFKVVVSGPQFEGYFDGKLIRKWEEDLYMSGRIGIGVGCGAGTQAVFDDLVIAGESVPDRIPPPQAMPVAPKNKLATTWGEIKHHR